MKKLLIIAGFASAAVFYSCDDKTPETPAATASGSPSDSVIVSALSSSTAKAMIQHFKSSQAAPYRDKLFRGGMKIPNLDSILSGATKFNIFAAAYTNTYSDSSKRNRPTFILQVTRSSSDPSAEATVSYYIVDDETLCPPPPDCNTVLESSE